jgi:secreted PhoX family phosphatase
MATHSHNLRLLLGACLLASAACGDDVAGDTDTDGGNSTGPTSSTTPTSGTPTSGTPTSGTTDGPTTADPDSSGTTDPDPTEGETGSTTGGDEALTIPQLVKSWVDAENEGRDVPGFPLLYADNATDLRVSDAFEWTLMSAFLEPITTDDSVTGPVWGSNNDFIAYLGDDWDGSPYYSGSGEQGWMWTNFEYISNSRANEGSAPEGQGLQMVTWLSDNGAPGFDFDVTDDAAWTAERVDAYIAWHKQMVGGALYRVAWGDDGWAIDTDGDNQRFDATSNTLFRVTGGLDLGTAQDDAGEDLPAGVVPGTASNCSGGVTPWGTIMTAEENTQFSYGDVESCWTSSNVFIEDGPCDPGSAIAWDDTPNPFSDFTRGSTVTNRPTHYSFMTEIDPESPANMAYDSTSGDGHQKLGSFGRARWENVSFFVDDTWNLVDGQPIVFYAGDDRRGGRLFKWVSSANYEAGMTKAEIRNMLADGNTYVAHFADLDNSDDDSGAEGGVTVNGELASVSNPGSGEWILLDVDNRAQTAPNASGVASGTSVGEALQNNSWNNIGGFDDNQTLKLGLFTACNKIGIRELNRPEDVEWNPVTGELWIAFTNHTRANALNDDGSLNLDDPDTDIDEHGLSARSDGTGAIVVLMEADAANPGASMTFEFRTAWRGEDGNGIHAAANPDNLAIDSEGGVWFGTDGNFSAETQDAIYYLETADNAADAVAWRVASVPSDAEATGPMFSSDERTLFFNVQHPQEDLDEVPSSDFAAFGELGPRSGQVALTVAEE